MLRHDAATDLGLQSSQARCVEPSQSVNAVACRLLRLGPCLHVAVLVDFDVNDVWATANRAILDELLAAPHRRIDRNDDLFATGIADVAGFVLHVAGILNRKASSGAMQCRDTAEIGGP